VISPQCQTTVITAGWLIRLFSLHSHPNHIRICLLQPTLLVVRSIDSYESHFADEASASNLELIFRSVFCRKVFHRPKTISYFDWSSKTEVLSNLSTSWINIRMNFWRSIWRMMNRESKLSVPTSALPKCRS
jgi:hypothetical protein